VAPTPRQMATPSNPPYPQPPTKAPRQTPSNPPVPTQTPSQGK
jgi:hypothetical protein